MITLSAFAASVGNGQMVASAPNLCSFVLGSDEYTALEETGSCSALLASGGAEDPCTCLDDVSYDNAYWSSMRCILSEANGNSLTANWLQCRAKSFCQDYAETCSDQEQYSSSCGSDDWHTTFDESAWLVSGATSPSNTVSCRVTQLARARDNAVQREHSCFAASPSGGDVCIEVSAIPAGNSRSGLVISDERLSKAKTAKLDTHEHSHQDKAHSTHAETPLAKHAPPSKIHIHDHGKKKDKHGKKDKKAKTNSGKKKAKITADGNGPLFQSGSEIWGTKFSVVALAAAFFGVVGMIGIKRTRGPNPDEYGVGLVLTQPKMGEKNETSRLKSPSGSKATYHSAATDEEDSPLRVDDWPDDYLIPEPKSAAPAAFEYSEVPVIGTLYAGPTHRGGARGGY